MNRVLISGTSGFIGDYLFNRLKINHGLCVCILPRAFFVNSKEISLDVNDFVLSEGRIFESIDTVFHLAGKAHALADIPQHEAEYFQINTEGTRKLLEAAKKGGVEKFIYFSSVKAVGDSGRQPMDELVMSPADTPYGRSKYAAEQLVLYGGYVPHPVVIRPSMVYGNTEKGNLPRMIQAIKRGVFPPLPETHNHRSMVHVDDVVQAAILAAENPESAGQIYIVTDDQTYSTRQIYDWIRAALGKSPSQLAIPMSILSALAKTGDLIGSVAGRRFSFDSDALDKLTGSAWYSSAKIQRELGFSPKHTLPSSLPGIVRYLQGR